MFCEFRIGDIIETDYDGEPADARVLKINGTDLKVEWVGYENDPPDWVRAKYATLKHRDPVIVNYELYFKKYRKKA